MSGRTIGTIAGAAIGFFVPVVGPALGATVGGMIGGALDPEHFNGPRLGDIPMQTAQEGVPRPVVYGVPPPFHGNLMQIGPVIRRIVEEEAGKGGPTTDREEVYQTYAIRICEGEAVCLKAWRDEKLVFDRTGTGEIDADSAAAASKLTFYTGDETQLPDPVLEALPAEYGGGAGEVNAYRGTSYLVVELDNTTGLGGRIPQWKFLMASSATVTLGYSGAIWLATNGSGKFLKAPGGKDWTTLPTYTTTATGGSLLAGAGNVVCSDSADTDYSEDDGATWAASSTGGGGQAAGYHSEYINGRFWIAQGSGAQYIMHSPTGATFTSILPSSTSWGAVCIGGRPGLIVVGTNYGRVVYSTDEFGTDFAVNLFGDSVSVNVVKDIGSKIIAISEGRNCRTTIHGASWTTSISVGAIGDPRAAASDRSGTVVVCGTAGLSVSHDDALSFTVCTLPDTFVGRDVRWAAGLFVAVGRRLEGAGEAVVLTSPDGDTWTDRANNFGNEYIESVVPIICEGTEAPDSPGYYVTNTGEICGGQPDTAEVGLVYLDQVQLAIAARCGVSASEMDVTELAGIVVDGYLLGKQMTGSDASNALMRAYFYDLPEYDGKVNATMRGGEVVYSFDEGEFLDVPEEEDKVRSQAIELPRKVNLYFADPDANYATLPVSARRTSGNVPSESILAIELAMTLHRDDAAKKADIMSKIIWEEGQGRLVRELPGFRYSFLTDADPIEVDGKRWRIVRTDIRRNSIRIEARRDRVSNYMSNATAQSVQAPTPPTSNLKGPTLLQAMNLPSLRSADRTPGIYVAVTGLLPGWQGADILWSADEGATWNFAKTITKRAVMGELVYAIDADDGESSEPAIVVRLYDNRTMDSVTDAQLAARENGFAIGTDDLWEIGQAEFVDENSEEQFELSGVLRGQLSTTAAEHGIGDPFVKLDDAVRHIEIDQQFAGQEIWVKAVTRGTPPENNPHVVITYDPPTYVIDGGEVTT